MSTTSRKRAVLVQRFVPHYRADFFRNLVSFSAYDWLICAGQHPGRGAGGLPSDTADLPFKSISTRWIGQRYCWQSGIEIDRASCDVLTFELTYTILSNPLLIARARAQGIPCIGWGKGLSEAGGLRTGAKRLFERGLLSKLDAVIAYGESSRDHFVNMGVAPSRIFVAQNAMDTEAIQSRRASAIEASRSLAPSLRIPDGYVVCGYLGRLVAGKKIDSIVSAFEGARDQGLKAVLVIAGTGPDEGRLRQLVAGSRWQDDVRLVGSVPLGAENAYFQLFDVVLSFAAGGLGLLEAMANGRAIVTTPERWPETELLVRDSTAFVSATESVSDFSTELRRACSDESLRKQVAARAESEVARRASHRIMAKAFDSAVGAVVSPASEQEARQ